jgi:chromate transport protein ChrA
MRQTCFASIANAPVLLALSPTVPDYDSFVGTFGLALQGRTAWVELPVAVLLILSPVACLILFVISLRRTVSPSLRQRCAVTTFVLPLVALALYAFYESGIPPETNIRIDLLLIYPALALDFLFWPALLVRFLIYRRA